MASSRLFGNASIKWDSDASEHVLAVPLQGVLPADGSRIFRDESLDRTTFESFRIGSYLNDRVVTIRYEDQFNSLLSMLRAGIGDNKTLTYYPDVGDTGTSDDFIIVEPTEIEDVINREQDFRYFEEATVQLRIRKTDGSTWNTL
jgi:hypothetical protein